MPRHDFRLISTFITAYLNFNCVFQFFSTLFSQEKLFLIPKIKMREFWRQQNFFSPLNFSSFNFFADRQQLCCFPIFPSWLYFLVSLTRCYVCEKIFLSSTKSNFHNILFINSYWCGVYNMQGEMERKKAYTTV